MDKFITYLRQPLKLKLQSKHLTISTEKQLPLKMNYVKLILGVFVFCTTLIVIAGVGGALWGYSEFTRLGPAADISRIETVQYAQQSMPRPPSEAQKTQSTTTSQDKKAAPSSILFTIARGSGLSTIAQNLHYVNIIHNPWVFKLGVLTLRQQGSLKAGEYEITPGMSARAIAAIISDGKSFVRRFTVREGLTSFETVRLLREVEELSGEITSVPAEGTLLPQTYDYRLGEDRTAIIARLQTAMEDVRADLTTGPFLTSPHPETTTPPAPTITPSLFKLCKIKWEKKNNATAADNGDNETSTEMGAAITRALTDDQCWHKILTLASIVEKETGVAEERGRVAGVFYNRLARNMPLQTDPTVIYAITKGKHKNDGKGPLGRRLLKKDLQIDSPYNTYKYPGLPPGPIANPGRDAIEAVLDPEAHDYIYFVADGTGGHLFGKTLKEHNRNVAKWRKIRRAQK